MSGFTLGLIDAPWWPDTFAFPLGGRIPQVRAGFFRQLLKPLDDLGMLAGHVGGFPDVLDQIVESQAGLVPAISGGLAAAAARFVPEGGVIVREVEFPLAAADGLKLAVPVEVIRLVRAFGSGLGADQ